MTLEGEISDIVRFFKFIFIIYVEKKSKNIEVNTLESVKSLEKINKKATKILNKHVNDLYNDARKWHG